MRVNVVVAREAVCLQERKGIRIRTRIAIKVGDHDHDHDEDLFLRCVRKKTSQKFWLDANDPIFVVLDQHSMVRLYDHPSCNRQL